GALWGGIWSFAERAEQSITSKGPSRVKHLRLWPGMTAGALVREMSATGVLGGGRIGAAADVVEEMFRGPDFTNFLTLAGPMVPSGFRLLIGDLIDRGFLDAIVTSGANLTHDVIEALGLSLWSFSQTELLQLNPMADVTNMVEMAMTSKKLGVLILGGGLPKHHTLLASVLREGVDAAVQITADRPEPGGLSGAPLAESISWRKIRKGGRFVDVYGDATVCFPLIMAAVLGKVKKRVRTLRE